MKVTATGAVGTSGTPLFAVTPQDARRHRKNKLILRLITLVAVVAILPLVAILAQILIKGAPSFSIDFLLNSPLSQPKGIFNAIQGSLIMTFIGLVISGPIGVAGGIYLNEYASSRVSELGELLIDIMLGVPSILAGLFVYFVIVPILGHSGWAGSIALSILMVPVVMRTTLEVLRLVPAGLREASLALGVPRWITTIRVTCRTALSGIMTGLVLAISRGLGETAPLLLTSQSSNDSALNLGQPMNAMTVVIYSNASSADPQVVAQAWTTALVLFALALILNFSVRFKTINNRIV